MKDVNTYIRIQVLQTGIWCKYIIPMGRVSLNYRENSLFGLSESFSSLFSLRKLFLPYLTLYFRLLPYMTLLLVLLVFAVNFFFLGLMYPCLFSSQRN